jgi:hypothetical protein
MPEQVYHADPVPGGSLSSSGARRLLERPPAVFHHERHNGRPSTKAMEFGRLAHALILGTGDPIGRMEHSDMRRREAREEAADLIAQGITPMKATEYDQVMAMIAALQAHPIASRLLAVQGSVPEASMFWRDRETGVMCRGRLDELPPPTTGRLVVPDYKTAHDLSDREVERAIAAYGYHQQSEWYRAGIKALDLHDDPAFLFVMQEKTAPYLVRVVEIPHDSAVIGRRRNRDALRLYAKCHKAGHWPGYKQEIALIGLDEWTLKREK